MFSCSIRSGGLVPIGAFMCSCRIPRTGTVRSGSSVVSRARTLRVVEGDRGGTRRRDDRRLGVDPRRKGASSGARRRVFSSSDRRPRVSRDNSATRMVRFPGSSRARRRGSKARVARRSDRHTRRLPIRSVCRKSRRLNLTKWGYAIVRRVSLFITMHVFKPRVPTPRMAVLYVIPFFEWPRRFSRAEPIVVFEKGD